MSIISNPGPSVFELRALESPKPQEALDRWKQKFFPEQRNKEFTLLVNDQMEIFRHPSQQPLLPDVKYLVVPRPLWQKIVRFMSYSKKERHSGKSRFNMEELLLNNKLQIFAKNRNDEGDSRLFDLFTKFLKVASRSGVNPFGKTKREKESQFQMVKIGLEIIAIFLSDASSSDLNKIRKRAHEIRDNPPVFHPKGGLCLIGTLLIFLVEGSIIGIVQILQSLLIR